MEVLKACCHNRHKRVQRQRLETLYDNRARTERVSWRVCVVARHKP
jgi:hypothetical protein